MTARKKIPDVHRAEPTDVAGKIAAADGGDRDALAILYGEASCWLREAQSLPPMLSAWVGERLLELANVIHDARASDGGRKGSGDALAAACAKALRVRTSSRGRPASKTKETMDWELARDMWQMFQHEGVRTTKQAAERLVVYREKMALGSCTAKQAVAAWEKHKDKLPI